jgi:cupin fold WbuC family metalloprotein
MSGAAEERDLESRAGAAPSRAPVELVTRQLLARLAARAALLPRGRTNYNFRGYRDGYQRLLNVIQPGSYIQPHRHSDPEKSESFIVVQGEIAFFQFDAQGRVLMARRLGPRCDALAVDLAPGVWHCFLALERDTAVFEGKNGPYDPSGDKEFAGWAPPEGDPAAAAYMAALRARVE